MRPARGGNGGGRATELSAAQGGASGPAKPGGARPSSATSPARGVRAGPVAGPTVAGLRAGERGRCSAALRLRAAAPREAASGAALRPERPGGPAARAAAAAARPEARELVLQAGAEPTGEPWERFR
ncbi:spidroin-2-like [Colius striatus]|uniref:spidroin-2-like n=1 Tax=Colius striatus TaxID=57412 RepID=UPI002B1E0310|nr:spidroin-2-like [Colius striatus]